MIKVKSGDLTYEFEFDHAQIEITGVCNMKCKHCRAAFEKGKNLPLKTIKKIIDFACLHAQNLTIPENFRLIISGGEPFLHPKWYEIIEYAKRKGVKSFYITTNASVINQTTIDKLKNLQQKTDDFFIQISLDGKDSETHDKFRGYPGAFKKALNVTKLLDKSKIDFSIRTTIIPKHLNDMENRVKLAIKIKAKRIGFGSVIWHGRANKNLILNPKEKKIFIERFDLLRKKYSKKIIISTEDPLKFKCNFPYLLPDDVKVEINDPSFFGGCTAGISGFDSDSNGNLRACTVLDLPIVNINKANLKQLTKIYENSQIIKDLASRNLKGKCEKCSLKRLCGGCRAQAYAFYKDYMAQDPTCWSTTK